MALIHPLSTEASLHDLGEPSSPVSGESDDDFFRPAAAAKPSNNSRAANSLGDVDDEDCVVSGRLSIEELERWRRPGALEALRNRFVTGDWSVGEARAQAKPR